MIHAMSSAHSLPLASRGVVWCVCVCGISVCLSVFYLTLIRSNIRFGSICKQHRPYSDAAFAASEQGLHCFLTVISMQNTV